MAQNNCVVLQGLILSIHFSHETHGEKFRLIELSIERKSGVADVLNIIASEWLQGLDVKEGEYIKVKGEFRSRNVHTPERSRLELSVFATEITKFDSEFDYLFDRESENRIELDGYICKPPVLRKTPYGRVIADVLLAVNRTSGRSDYIPCVMWGRTAGYVSSFPVGSRLKLTGRIQSRKYNKKLTEEHMEIRTAYEVSVNELQIIAKEDENNGEDV